MKKSFIYLLILNFFLLVSCENVERKASEELVRSFYQALRKEDSLGMVKYYPNYSLLGGYFKSRNIAFTGFESLGNNKFELLVHNDFENLDHQKFEQNISFFIEKKGSKYSIIDSEGLVDFESVQSHYFAQATGYIDRKKNYTDLERVGLILKSEELLKVYYLELVEQLKKEVVIEGWGWNFGFINTYADGKGLIINNSPYDFSNVRYHLSFVDAAGNITKKDEGYLIYSSIKSKEKINFTTTTSDIGNAVKAYIEPVFDINELIQIIYKRKYKGNEFKLIH